MKKKMSNLKVALRLTSLVKPLMPVMTAAVVLGVLGHLAAISITVLGAWMIISGSEYVKGLAIALVVLAVSRGVLHYAEQDCNHYIAFRLLAIIRDKVFGALRRLAPAKLEGRDKGNLISLLTSDIELLEVFYAHTLSPVCIAFIVSLVMTFYIGSFSVGAGVIAALAYISIGIVLPLIAGRKAAPASAAFRSDLGALSSTVLESLHGVRETLQYDDSSSRLALLDKYTKHLSASEGRVKRQGGMISGITSLLIILFSSAVLAVSSLSYLEGGMDFSSVLIPTVAMISSFGPVVALANLGAGLQNTFASGARVLDILDEEPETADITDGQDVVFDGAAAEHVSFAYDKEEILKDFSLELENKSIVGIVGRSGSGKSTFLRLLMRFWDVGSGSIRISGTDIRNINTHSLRENESFVTQSTMLFHDSIRNNLLIAKPDATDAELEAACRKASVHDFIMTLPKGYDSEVGELGDTLSGGEKQRLGLARAFLHDSPLILLDEPTSNLDSLNEAAILRSLKREKGERSVILVSHRASTMRIADKTVRMDNGRMS